MLHIGKDVEPEHSVHEHDEAEQAADVEECRYGDDERHHEVAQPLELLDEPQHAQDSHHPQHPQHRGRDG